MNTEQNRLSLFSPAATKETLLDAQKNPQNHPELQVKGSGYSARLIDIHRSLLDDIIARTDFDDG